MTHYSAGSVKPWREGFPLLFSHTTIAALKRHSDYAAAKESGDIDAARRLVADLIKPDRVEQLAALYPDAIIVSVMEKEAGKNVIPQALGRYIAEVGKLRYDENIVDVSTSTHTGEGMISRLLARKKFQGPVVAGGKYLMVDDVFTQGGTFHELRHHLANNGADAVAAVSLAFSRHGNTLAIQQETINNLTERFDREELEALLQKNDISGSIEALTENEGRSLLRFKSLESIRIRIHAAILPGSCREETRTEYAEPAGTGGVQSMERPSDSGTVQGHGTSSYQARLNLALFGDAALEAAPPTRADLLSAFPYAQITSSDDTHVVTAGNACFSIRFVDRIRADEASFLLNYGRKPGPGDAILGETAQGCISIARVGDKNTIRHETYHIMEDMGLVTAQEQGILDAAARDFFARRPGLQRPVSPHEMRAHFVEHALQQREYDRSSAVGLVLQKLADFIDAFSRLALGPSARSVIGDIEQGKPFERARPRPRMR